MWVIILLLLIGGGAFAYFKYFVKSPEKQIQAGIAALVSSKSFAFEGEIKSNSPGVAGATLNGQISQEQAKIELAVTGLDSNLNVTLLGFSKEAFLKVDGLTVLAPLLSFGDVDVEARLVALDNVYIHLSEEFLDGLMEGLGLSTKRSPLSDTDIKRLADAIASAEFITVQEKLPGKDINGKKAKGYRAVFNAEGIVAFLREVKDLDIESVQISDQQIKDAEKLKQSDLDKTPADFWLQDGRLVQVEFEDDGDEGVSIRLTFSKFGETFKVDKPSDFAPIEDLLDLIQFYLFVLAGALGTPTDGATPLPALE